jgi:phosphoenolpyruvate-protein phosphotransferase
MALGVRHGDIVALIAEGMDAEAAIEGVVAAIDEALRLERASGPPAMPIAVTSPIPQGASDSGQLSGVIAVPGFAIGRTARLERAQISVVEAGRGAAHESAELERARNLVRTRLSRVGGAGDATRREIVEAHLAFVDDPLLNETAQDYIAAGKASGFAWRAATRQAIVALESLGDARLRERADDLLDVESHVLLALTGEARPMNLALPENAVVVADELLPSELVALDRSRLRAICLSGGGPTSHVAILAAAMDVPMLVGMGPSLRNLANGEQVIVDAERGTLHVAPPAAVFTQASQKAERLSAQHAAERSAAQQDCRTRDGTRIEMFANLGGVAEAEAAVGAGAEGCGLLRTEFLFIDRDAAPGEHEQLEVYQAIADALRGRPLVLRLMDVGGDKPLRYLPLPPEENPALGLRGIRTALRHPQLLEAQLRAALRVTPSGIVRILLPMITDVADVHAVRAVIDALQTQGHGAPIEVGAMIETPAAALTAEKIATAADFLSIGSNDLTQYALAMDRGHPELARRIDALHPAVLKLIALAAAAGERRGKTVAVCGGVAADPAAVPLLIGFGVRELSVVPAAIPALKRQIRGLNVPDCVALATRSLELESAAEVRALVARARSSGGAT